MHRMVAEEIAPLSMREIAAHKALGRIFSKR
jgi:hypothetical protein